MNDVFTEDLKGEKDAGKEAKAAKEETAKGNGKPPAERPRFMFNIADGGFTGESPSSSSSGRTASEALASVPEELCDVQTLGQPRFSPLSAHLCFVLPRPRRAAHSLAERGAGCHLLGEDE